MELVINAESGINAAGDGFADDDGIGSDIFVLEAEVASGTSEADLDFVEDQHEIVLVGEIAETFQEACGRNVHAAFALHWFDEDTAGIGS